MGNRQTEYQRKYDSSHCRVYGLKLNRETDSDIIDRLASVPSMQGYIKQLIRNDILVHPVPVFETDPSEK